MSTSPSRGRGASKTMLCVLTVGLLLTVAVLGISVAVLIKVYNGFQPPHEAFNGGSTSVTAASTAAPQPPTLVASININDVMAHLREFQSIADRSNGTRAVGTIGFNRTLDYIYTTLNTNTNFNISRSPFGVRQFELNSVPIFISSISGREENYTYSETLSRANFSYVRLSTRANFSSFVPVTAIANVGCTDADWQAANSPASGRVALVKRGICLFSDKAKLAIKYNALALLFYNDGTSPDRTEVLAVNLGHDQYLPALFLSYAVGDKLAKAASNSSSNTGVRMVIDLKNLPLITAENICADTPTGDSTQTIVIGSHSDSVPAGPGINDNGSGSAANLALVIALARLFRSSSYAEYPYRIRFCWWGAEEVGLIGSENHVQRAKNTTEVGERLRDYLINLNYDMLGSPNFIFGIYDITPVINDVPASAVPGSSRISAAFRDWFQAQSLPWTYVDSGGQSDDWPFSVEGIVVSGLFTGANSNKTMKERDEYAQLLGTGLGGIAETAYDPCYHKACDSIQNINVFAFEKMVKATAYMLEYLAQKSNLTGYLYPNGRATIVRSSTERQNQHSAKERYGFVTL